MAETTLKIRTQTELAGLKDLRAELRGAKSDADALAEALNRASGGTGGGSAAPPAPGASTG